QHLVDVMTDKATVEMTSPVSGKVLEVHGEPGSMAPVGAPLVIFEVEGAGNEKATNGAAKVAKPAPVAVKASEPPPAPKPIAKAAPAPAPKPVAKTESA